MNYGLLYRTLRHLKMKQLLYQLRGKFYHPQLVHTVAPVIQNLPTIDNPIDKYKCFDGKNFDFLNIRQEFKSWNDVGNGMLWAFNLNYMDWINQKTEVPGSASEAVKSDVKIHISDIEYWIDKFIDELPGNRVGLDPYPIALRAINWIKFFCLHPECRNERRDNSLYSQVMLLGKKLEYRLLGNHLLEDAYALYIASIYFDDDRMFASASKLLLEQLNEQVLSDGAHFEQSPMYQCVLLDRLLDCVNFTGNASGEGRINIYNVKKMDGKLRNYAERMLGHLKAIVWNDDSIPLLNDSANGIAPPPQLLFNYAYRLGVTWKEIPMSKCGYRKMQSERMEAIVDVGNITATYQPGHSHADTLNYELRIDGKPFVVDTGTSTYNKNQRRQYERSTIAHNCVSPAGKNSSEVWGGFRIGRRAKANIISEDVDQIVAAHDGFRKPCRRTFSMKEDAFIVEDEFEGSAVSYLFLAEGADITKVQTEGATKIEIEDVKYSTEYNRFRESKVMKIYFKNKLKYKILV